MASAADRAHMRQAIALMRQAGVVERTGGPFGAVVVRDGVVLGAAGNSVLRDHDPTAHAEVNAIRQACRALGSHDLRGAVLYASGECCPMCYAAAYWARISKVYFASFWSDYADLFDDVRIHADMARPAGERQLAPEPLLRAEALPVWEEFRRLQDGACY
ncbi:nucleoside deaminase [Cyanobium sp. CH-040]|uniref:nucleoside deaminase n=1 Tax=Cyanobium sp. CH-040 TaxID=2823708 RepID=UPI0020CF67C1|nr:nucleoside deaminase [Cyanobium sp. CH-040]MCP9928300.1 nucleoside deaminase [Cyanobium sp. CH-040]